MSVKKKKMEDTTADQHAARLDQMRQQLQEVLSKDSQMCAARPTPPQEKKSHSTEKSYPMRESLATGVMLRAGASPGRGVTPVAYGDRGATS